MLEAKAYRHAKAMVDGAEDFEARKRLPRDGLVPLVREIEGELMLLEANKQS